MNFIKKWVLLTEDFPIEINCFYIWYRYELDSTDLCIDIFVPSWWCYFERARNFGPWSLAGGCIPLGMYRLELYLTLDFPLFLPLFLGHGEICSNSVLHILRRWQSLPCTEISETLSQNKFFFKPFSSYIIVKVRKAWLTWGGWF